VGGLAFHLYSLALHYRSGGKSLPPLKPASAPGFKDRLRQSRRKRSYTRAAAGPKSRKAAVSWQTVVCYRLRGSTGGVGTAPPTRFRTIQLCPKDLPSDFFFSASSCSFWAACCFIL
jgi:hypothetical protein